MSIPPEEDERPWLRETPTDSPCPTWCSEPYGHPYRVEVNETDLSRLHVGFLADLRPWKLNLSILQLEYVMEGSEPPAVQFEEFTRADETGALPIALAAQSLRKLAATILDGADTLDGHIPDNQRLADTAAPLGTPTLDAIDAAGLLDDLAGTPPLPGDHCPSWCDRQDGHPYRVPRPPLPGVIDTSDRELIQGAPSRLHTHRVTDLRRWGLLIERHQVDALSERGEHH